MNKDDVKAIFALFFILLVMSTIVLLGINIYLNLTEKVESEQEVLFEGNTTVLPEEETVNNTTVEQKEEALNQIETADKNSNTQTTTQNQNTQANTANQNQATQGNVTNQNQVTQGNATNKNDKTQISSTNQSQTQNAKEQYYYKQLNTYSKLIYNNLKNNKENLKTGTYKLEFNNEFDALLKQENGADLLQEYYQSGMETFLYDNPDVFYLEPTKMYINIQTTKKVFTTTYEVYLDQGDNANYLGYGYNNKQQIIQSENLIKREIQSLLTEAQGKSAYEKILLMHDYLVDNVAYEETLSKNNIYNMYGAIANKEAVCEGYAKAFKYLLDQVGIESIVVIGDATDSTGKTQSHAWNYVKLNNKWYAVDVTWDDPVIRGIGILTKKHKYKYFLKGSITMKKDHNESNTFIDNGKVYTLPVLSTTDYK